MEPGLRAEEVALAHRASQLEVQVLGGGSHIQPTQDLTLADYWRILMKRKWVLVASLLITMTLVIFISLRITPMYTAVAKISIGRNSSILNFKNLEENMALENNDQIAIDTQVNILKSESLAIQAVRRLNLDKRKDFAGSSALAENTESSDHSSTEQIERETNLIQTLQAKLKVTPVEGTTVIELHYSDRNPRLAAEISNGLVQTYIEQNIRSKFDSTMQAADFLAKQLADLQIKMETSQEKLVRYQKEHNILGIDEKQNIITTKLDELNRQLTAAEADRFQKQSLYEIVDTKDTDALSSVLQEPVIGSLRMQINDMQTQMAQLQTQFGPAYPRVLELRSRIAQAQLSVDNELKKGATRIRSEYRISMQREQMLRSALEKQKQEANALNESAIEYKVLKQETESNRQLYEGLLQKMKEATVSASMNSSNVRVIDAARVPLSPSSPNIPRNLEFGFVFGIVIGVAGAFALELLDNTVRTAEQAERISGVSVLAMIPDHSALPDKKGATNRGNSKKDFYGKPLAIMAMSSQRRIVALTEPRSELAEAYRALRTAILLSNPGAPAKVLVFTSCLPQEGKTTTAVNVAVLLAQQGKRVLLVDADMRRPSIHKILQVRSTVGLSALLSGNSNVESAIVQVPELPTLSVIPAGKLPPHPSELLGGPIAGDCIQRWRSEYDHIIFDTPPLLSVTDALLLSTKADSTIFIVRAGRTSTVALRRSRNLLANMRVHVMGTVLNAIDLSSPDHYHYYYSGYSGGYYSSNEPVQEKVATVDSTSA